MNPYILIDDGGVHSMPTTPGVLIIVMNGSVYVRDGGQVVAFGANSSVHLSGTSSGTAYYGAQIIQNGPGTTATAYQDSTITSYSGDAYLMENSHIVFVEGGSTNAWLLNTAHGSVFDRVNGTVHLGDMASLVFHDEKHLVDSQHIHVQSPHVSFWVGEDQYIKTSAGTFAPADQPAPTSSAVVDDIADTTVSAPPATISATDDAPSSEAAPMSEGSALPPITYAEAPGVVEPVERPAFTADQFSSATAMPTPPRTTIPAPAEPADTTVAASAAAEIDVAARGFTLYDDYDSDELVVSDWNDMQPWSRSPWYEITRGSGDRAVAVLDAVDLPSAPVDSQGLGGSGLGTIALPETSAIRGTTFTPPGM